MSELKPVPIDVYADEEGSYWMRYWSQEDGELNFHIPEKLAQWLQEAIAAWNLREPIANRESRTEPESEDRIPTQRFVVRDMLTRLCGLVLTADLVDEITHCFEKEMEHGPCAWAFLPTEPRTEPIAVVEGRKFN